MKSRKLIYDVRTNCPRVTYASHIPSHISCCNEECVSTFIQVGKSCILVTGDDDCHCWCLECASAGGFFRVGPNDGHISVGVEWVVGKDQSRWSSVRYTRGMGCQLLAERVQRVQLQ